jgi:peptidoglycan/xylan/chitin deacetylase (PgdA/CDA1 family)
VPGLRIFVTLLSVLLLLALFAPRVNAATPSRALAAAQPGTSAATTTALNLRTGPSVTAAVQLVMPAGAVVYVNGGPYNSVWYDVTYNGSNGYAHGGYLTTSTSPAVRTGAYAVTTTALNLRSGPSTSNTILRVIPGGGRVFVQKGPYNSVWFQATYSSVTGYVHGAYLTKGKAAVVQQLATTQKVVALTFDAGSDTGYAAQILDTLKRNGIKASFGMTGVWAHDNPALLQRMVAEGHTIINHGSTHASFTGGSTGAAPLSYMARVNELWNTEQMLGQLTSTSSKPFFRPPYGDYNTSVLQDIYSRGYSYNIMWSCDTLGWKGLSQAQIVQRVVANLKPGAIYLLHVGGQSQDGPALQGIVEALRARGYGFATIKDYSR